MAQISESSGMTGNSPFVRNFLPSCQKVLVQNFTMTKRFRYCRWVDRLLAVSWSVDLTAILWLPLKWLLTSACTNGRRASRNSLALSRRRIDLRRTFSLSSHSVGRKPIIKSQVRCKCYVSQGELQRCGLLTPPPSSPDIQRQTATRQAISAGHWTRVETELGVDRDCGVPSMKLKARNQLSLWTAFWKVFVSLTPASFSLQMDLSLTQVSNL